MLTGPTRLCRPCLPAEPAHAAATAGFSILEGEIPGETDCLLEQTGFEPPIPRKTMYLRAAFFTSPDVCWFSRKAERRRGHGMLVMFDVTDP
jgi:hypothetical protein